MSGPAVPAVGNDVVDLGHPRCRGKSDDARFLRRILSPRELPAVLGATDPDRALWTRWAAKEAAFKAATALRGRPPVFEHAAFVVEEGPAGRGVVRWEGSVFDWRLEPAPADGNAGTDGAGTGSGEPLHVVAWRRTDAPTPVLEPGLAPFDPAAPPPRERFTERELPAVHSAASAWVRIHAREHLARLLGTDEGELEVVCEEGPPGRAPPRLFRSEEPLPWALSLSHHGRWVAWLLARSPSDQSSGGR